MGEGSIFRQINGKWCYEYTIGRKPDGTPIRKRRTFAKRADAVAAKKQVLAAKINSPDVPLNKLTVEGYLTDWLKTVEENRARNTYQSYKLAVTTHIAPHIGGILLQQLNGLHIESMIRANKSGARTKQNAYAVLSAALSRAVKLKLIPFNPAAQVDKPTHKRAKINPFEVADVKAILETIAGHRLEAAFWLLFTSGIRQGELLGLHWEDIDLVEGKLFIHRQAIEISGWTEIAPLKSESSVRTVRLTNGTIDALRRRQKHAMKEGLAGCEIAFPTRPGKIHSKSSFASQVWKVALIKAGIDPRGMHHARHTFATLALASGVPIRDVSQALGHASPSFTLDTYSHFMDSVQSKARDEMGRLFG